MQQYKDTHTHTYTQTLTHRQVQSSIYQSDMKSEEKTWIFIDTLINLNEISIPNSFEHKNFENSWLLHVLLKSSVPHQ